ncbi:hypothetical protein [Microlunatus kandeliicorticis]|uniref:hypothetical protein n=1 Tax=Microlunatus kandeliicorticis TaxID=1759536 RepID=UPI0015FE42AB|nr:hypothetical protein [Microlunatus kandeliicorticis]
MAQTAGTSVGTWVASPATHIGTELLLAGLCIYAGADLNQLEEHLRVGFERGRRSLGPVYGMDLWRRAHGGQIV